MHKDRERESPMNDSKAFWSIKQPYAHRAVKENHLSALQGMSWVRTHKPVIFSFAFPLKTPGMERKGEREEA